MSREAAFSSQRRRLLANAGLTLSAGASGLLLPSQLWAQDARTTDTVRLGWRRSDLPLLAKERGEFEKTLAAQDIKVEWVGPFPNHAPSLQAVVGGSADFSFWGSSSVTLASIIAGSPLVFTCFHQFNPVSTSIIVKNNSGIDSVPDLVGRKVAVNRSGLGEFILVAALEKYGIPRETVEFIYLNPPDAAPAFGQGKVDAWAIWSPTVDIARDQYDAKNIFFQATDLDFSIDFTTLVAARKFAQKNPGLVRAVIDAYKAEAKWIDEHREEAEAFAQQEGKYNDAVRRQLLDYRRYFTFYETDDATFLDEFQKGADWLSGHGVLPRQVNVRDHVFVSPAA